MNTQAWMIGFVGVGSRAERYQDNVLVFSVGAQCIEVQFTKRD